MLKRCVDSTVELLVDCLEKFRLHIQTITIVNFAKTNLVGVWVDNARTTYLACYGAASVLLICMTSSASGTCSIPILPPMTYDRVNWTELEHFSANPGLNQLIQKVETINGMGYGKLNIDFFSVTIDSKGDNASSLFKTIYSNLNSIVFSGSSYSVSPYDTNNASKWNSNAPKGAIMTFTLAEIPHVMPLERGSVVLSCITDIDFIFSTVVTEKDGLHPVAGNRAFGVRDNGNGSLTIYTKAADRIVNAGIFGQLPESGRELIFNNGRQVWLRLLDNISAKYSDRNPRGRTEFGVRVDY